MHVLARRISPYSGADPLFLGLFSDAVRAKKARDDYLATVSSAGDPWERQAYRAVNLQEDVVIIEVQDRRIDVNRGVVFLVTSYFESMGQSVRHFEAVFSDRESANIYAKEREAGTIDNIAYDCDVDEVVLNVSR